MTLGEKILQLRTARALSQGDLAEKLEVSRQSVSKWETDQSTPDLDKIIKLADLYGVTVDELVREEERPKPPEPQVVYVKETRTLTRTQTAGVCMEAAGAGMAVLGIMLTSLVMVYFAAVPLVILGLPLLLAKKHPWLICGWLAVTLSLLVLNPYTSVSPLGPVGGLRSLWVYLTMPSFRSTVNLLRACIGLLRGTAILVLAYFTWKAFQKRKKDG